MVKEARTCNRKSEDCLRLFGVNILTKKPLTGGDTLSLTMENLKQLNGEKSCKDEYFSQEFDQQLHINDSKNMGTFILIPFINNTMHFFFFSF